MQNKKIQLWELDLQGYNCKVEYVSGINLRAPNFFGEMKYLL